MEIEMVRQRQSQPPPLSPNTHKQKLFKSFETLGQMTLKNVLFSSHTEKASINRERSVEASVVMAYFRFIIAGTRHGCPKSA